MDRLFLDANVLFSAAYREDAGVTRLWSVKGVRLLTSEYAVEEARRNLSSSEQQSRLEDLLASMERTGATTLAADQRGGIELREKDWPIVAGAVQAGATHLITGDHRDFGRYFGVRILGVLVQTPSEYLRSEKERAL